MSRWSDVQELFERLRDVPPAARRTVLDAHDDQATVVEVTSLLAAHDDAGGFLEEPAFEPPDTDDERWTEQLLARGQIGPYEVTRVLGAGGMGVVMEARQRHPDRKVALKLLRGVAGTDDALRVRLFKREVEVLARLDHPEIARIHDAGLTDDGQHWFTMELVSGEPLDAHVRDRGLSLRQRVDLLRRVCVAVSYAHQRGVIHCDLKPSNVLVSDAEGEAGIKVLDFGLARVSREGQDSQASLGAGMRGSLGWMSPEQTRFEDERVDVRADVYALGVMLYQLVTDQDPYDLEGLAPLEAARVIRETPPRSMPPGFPRDLKTIVTRCLEKRPARRYAGSTELAEELRRWLHKEPILARPPSALYHVTRFCQRNRALVSSVVLIMGLSVAFAIYASVQAARLEVERDEADRNARSLDGMFSWLQKNILAPANPTRSRDPEITLAEVLKRQARAVERDFGDDPLVAAKLHHMIGRAWQSLSLYRQAAAELEQALKLRLRHLGPDHDIAVSTMNDLASVLELLGRASEAEALYRDALSVRRQRFGEQDHPLLLVSINNLGLLLREQGRYEEALPLLEEGLRRRRRSLPQDHPHVLSSMNNLGGYYVATDRHELAEPLLEAVLERRRAALPLHHPDLVNATLNLAKLEMTKGDLDAAESLLRTVRDAAHDKLGADSRHVIALDETLSFLLRQRGRISEALALQESAVKRRRAVFGDGSRTTVDAISKLARLYGRTGAYKKGTDLYEEVIRTIERDRLYESRIAVEVYHNLVELCVEAGSLRRAVEVARQSIDSLTEQLSPEHSSVLVMRSALGRVLVQTRAFEEAEQELRDTLEIQERVDGRESRRALMTALALSNLCLMTDRPQEAESLSRFVVEASGRRRGANSREALEGSRRLGSALMAQGRWQEASEVLEELARGLAAIAPDAPDLQAVVLVDRAECEGRLNRFASAERLYRRADALFQSRTIDRTMEPGFLRRLLTGYAGTLEATGKQDEADAVRARLIDR